MNDASERPVCASCESKIAQCECSECGEECCTSCLAFIGEHVKLCEVCWTEGNQEPYCQNCLTTLCSDDRRGYVAGRQGERSFANLIDFARDTQEAIRGFEDGVKSTTEGDDSEHNPQGE